MPGLIWVPLRMVMLLMVWTLIMVAASWRIPLLCFKNSAFFAVTSSLTHDHIRAVGAYDGGLRPTLS